MTGQETIRQETICQEAGRAESWAAILRFAARELRGGVKSFRVFLFCLFLGVGTLAVTGTLTRGLSGNIEARGQIILGGDVVIGGAGIPVPEGVKRALAKEGRISEVVRLRTMARAEKTGLRTLVELKGVDGAWPLYGKAVFDRGSFRPGFPKDGAFVTAELAQRLKLKPGDSIRIGNAVIPVSGRLLSEPDKAAGGVQFGPTLLVPLRTLEKTGLIVPGALANSEIRLRLSDPALAEKTAARIMAWPEASGWRARTPRDAAPGLKRIVERMGSFLTLAGLSSLLIGGIGAGIAVRTWAETRRSTLAAWKILGAGGPLLFRIYLVQILTLAAAAIAAGLIAGIAVPPLIANVLAEKLPVAAGMGVYPAVLAEAAAEALLIVLGFILPPLSAAAAAPASLLLRGLVAGEDAKPGRGARILSVLCLAAALSLLVIFSPLPGLAAAFLAGTAAVLGVLYLSGTAFMRLLAALPRPSNPAIRAGLANLYRPGAATMAVILSLGLGLTLLSSIHLIGTNLAQEISGRVARTAPSFFFLDIRKDEAEDFRRLAARYAAEPGDLRMVPMARGPVTALKGIPAAQWERKDGAGWILNGDRGLTFAEVLPEGNRIVAGHWWPRGYAGPPLVSLDADAVQGLGLKVGDTIAVSVLGRPVTARIANFRAVDWGDFGVNFAIIFAPGVIDAAPYSELATLRLDPAHEEKAWNAITDAFPAVTVIKVKEMLDAMDKILSDASLAVRLVASVSLLTAVAVLAGAVAAGRHRRIYDAVVLKTMGAGRGQLMLMLFTEFAVLGLMAGLPAAALAALAAYLAVTFALNMTFILPVASLAAVISASAATVAVLGLAGTFAALTAKPNRILRELRDS